MPVTSGKSARAACTFAFAARASSRVAPVIAWTGASFGGQGDLEQIEHGRDGVREGEALAVAAALVAPGEEQGRRLAAQGREDQRAAVAALAERLGGSAF